MRKTSISLVTFFVALLTITSCNNERPEFCDPSGWDSVNIAFKADVTAHYTNGEPFTGTVVRVVFHKVPCGEPAKGFIEYTGTLNSERYHQLGVANYNINHPEDVIAAKPYINNGQENLEVFRQIQGVNFDIYPDGAEYVFTFDIDDVPL